MKLGDGSEAVLKGVELHKRHVLIGRLLQDVNSLHLTVLLEDATQHLLPAYLLLQRGDMEGLGRSIDGDGFGGRESVSYLGYRS